MNNSTDKSLKSLRNEAEYKMIVEAIINANFNKSKAAISLNINRRTLYNKLKALKEAGLY